MRARAQAKAGAADAGPALGAALSPWRSPRPFVFYPVFVMKALCFALFACAFNLLMGYVGLLSVRPRRLLRLGQPTPPPIR